jgi:DNA recombination protein RmuC
MTNTYLLIAVLLVNAAIIFLLFRRRSTVDAETLRPLIDGINSESRRVESSLKDEFSRQRGELSRDAQGLREEVNTRLTQFGEANDTRLSRLRGELNEGALQARTEMRQQLEKVRETMEVKLTELQSKNEQKLEEMRKTVDEKLEGTLEKRLGESFKLVSERLEQVHKGLGEMQSMASSVGDLKKVLTNVKTRGTWGEIQLGALLEQVLTPEQYELNVAVRPGSGERVEFAIKLPGKNDSNVPLWLPIDAKFPQEDYQRLIEATECGDTEGIAAAGKALETRLRNQAKDISTKYIAPPHTTDFAILFLPSESLYAETLRRPGLWERIQADYKVTITGPTTIAALLNSLQMGFRTLAIQQRSSEVWNVLGAIKTEFTKYGEILAKVKKKIEEAGSQIEQTERRTRVINRTLRDVEALPTDKAAQIIPATAMLAAEDTTADELESETPLFIPNKRLDI